MESAIDTHAHFWDLQHLEYLWPRPLEESAIYRNFLPNDYDQERKLTSIKHAVFVEAQNSAAETDWALKLADQNHFIKGVVGFATLEDENILKKELERFTKNKKFVGVRRIPDFENDGWFKRDDVQRGLDILQEYDLVFELLIKKKHFADAEICVKNHPNLKFIIDHIAKPNALEGEPNAVWFDGMKNFSQYSNVHCKISGLVTEGDLNNWKPSDFKRYVDHVVECFGYDRLVYGSDWPVCKMANTNLETTFKLVQELLSDASEENKAKVFRTNAIKLYNL